MDWEITDLNLYPMGVIAEDIADWQVDEADEGDDAPIMTPAKREEILGELQAKLAAGSAPKEV